MDIKANLIIRWINDKNNYFERVLWANKKEEYGFLIRLNEEGALPYRTDFEYIKIAVQGGGAELLDIDCRLVPDSMITNKNWLLLNKLFNEEPKVYNASLNGNAERKLNVKESYDLLKKYWVLFSALEESAH